MNKEESLNGEEIALSITRSLSFFFRAGGPAQNFPILSVLYK
jgi:hypothetical protein